MIDNMASYNDDSHISLAEFDPPSPMTEFFVNPISNNEYEEVGAKETEKALKDLITFLEANPAAYANILKRRKFEEKENGGIFSMLKVRLMTKLKGDAFHEKLVTEDEVDKKLEEVKSGMMMAYNYAQETKGRRYSRRLALKKERERQLSAANMNRENVDIAGSGIPVAPFLAPPPPPPPPPPCPPPPLVLTPLKEKSNIMSSTPFIEPKKKLFGTGSPCSLSSVQSELVLTNPLKRLRATGISRSPGGTPKSNLCRRPLRDSLDTPNPLNRSESLSSAFFRIMEAKFQNVRSPSPSLPDATFTSPSDFSP